MSRIRRAVAEAREAMRREDSFTPLTFARTYIARDGVQIPGAEHDEQGRRKAGEALLSALQGRDTVSEDPHLTREMTRIAIEVQWALAARAPKVVGFRLQFGRQASRRPECRALLSGDHGLGPSVFRKGDVVVLPPDCQEAEFIPVLEDELEQ
ncbi:MAG TPA: hypothetical protein VKA13_00315 [Gammaproteobacteria bacterium]|nr:hypothetical protein [Gammaproteobacteria bacterium]